MSADCGEKQFDFFTSLVLDFSLYLGFTLLTVMIAVGLYFFLKYCCCKRCRKRWVRPRQGQSSLIRRVILMFRDRHAFSGIRSQPSFVATIQFAFSSNLITFTEIGKRLLSPNKNNVGNLFLIPSPPTTTQSKSFLNKKFDKKIFWNLNKTTSQGLVTPQATHIIIFHRSPHHQSPMSTPRWSHRNTKHFLSHSSM